MFMFFFAQASISLQIKMCVWSATAILWEHHSVGVIARLDSVCVSILQWEGSIVTSVVTCSMASTPDWAGNAIIQSHAHTQSYTD